jgi:hypothetical protein
MNDNLPVDRHEARVRRAGLFIAAAAALALSALTAYRVPLFHSELDGTIVGISEVHDETGSELMAAVQLDTGDQVLVSMQRDLLKSESTRVRINEGRTLFGRRSYRIVADNE